MLDTNILSDLMRRPDGPVRRNLLRLGEGAACMSVIALAELRFGAEKVGSTKLNQQIAEILTVVPAIPFEQPADQTYGQVRADLERQGRPIGSNDLFIAAHALSLDLTLVTANLREFSRVPGLRVENWLD